MSKPNPAFFDHVVGAAPCDAGQVLHVGDRLDDDIRPAGVRGLRTALTRRGPWGMIQQNDEAAATVPTLRIDSLGELPDLIEKFNATSH